MGMARPFYVGRQAYQSRSAAHTTIMFRDETEALLEAWGSWGSSPRAA